MIVQRALLPTMAALLIAAAGCEGPPEQAGRAATTDQTVPPRVADASPSPPSSPQPTDDGPDVLSSSRIRSHEASEPTTRYAFPIRPRDAATYGRGHHDYPATDIFAPCGTTVVSPTDGTVEAVNRTDRWRPDVDAGHTRGGRFVSLIGTDGVRYYLSHLRQTNRRLRRGERIRAGQRLGRVGRSGNAETTPCHVHFGISWPTGPHDWRVRRGIVWPWPYLDAWRAGRSRSPAAAVSAEMRGRGRVSGPSPVDAVHLGL